MKIAAISDVHIKAPADSADHLLCKFLDHELVRQADYVLLMGDIFDLMCGPHEEYLKLYSHIFEKMDQLAAQGKKIIFFEGNHDVHLKKLFEKKWKRREVELHQSAVTLDLDGKKYYFSHGDEHETENHSYQRYKKFILSAPLRMVANHLMPYSVLEFLGKKASQLSRKKGSKIFRENDVREKFRAGVKKVTKLKYDFVLGGHSHVQDMFTEKGQTYMNNGYALRSKSFIFIDDHRPSFQTLT